MRRGRTAQQAGVAVQDVLALAALQHGGRLRQLLRGLHRVVCHQVFPIADLRARGRRLSPAAPPRSALPADAALLRLAAARSRVASACSSAAQGETVPVATLPDPTRLGLLSSQPLMLLPWGFASSLTAYCHLFKACNARFRIRAERCTGCQTVITSPVRGGCWPTTLAAVPIS